MNDPPKTDAETPMERALRQKKAALAAKPKPQGRDRFQPAQAAGMTSKPALRK